MVILLDLGQLGIDRPIINRLIGLAHPFNGIGSLFRLGEKCPISRVGIFWSFLDLGKNSQIQMVKVIGFQFQLVQRTQSCPSIQQISNLGKTPKFKN